jgi:NDP-sugar pyrophosphorylase family protein
MATASSPANPAIATRLAATVLAGVDVVILAGGFGTRLRAVLPDRQKVVANVGGQPFLGKLIEFYSAAGAQRIILALGYRAEDVQAAVGGFAGVADVVASIEPEPRGTGGALRHALAYLRSDTVLVANGDSFAAVDLAALMRLHREKHSPATIALAHVEDISRYGRVVVDEAGAVIRFEEKPAAGAGRPAEAGYINAGIYLIERSVIAALPDDRAISLEREVFPQLIGRGMYGLAAEVPFIDIGTPESWEAADRFFAALGDLRGTS